MIRIDVLASGSSGNALLLRDGDAALLIDAGLSRRALTQRCQALSFELDRLQDLFVTHEHVDHVRGAPVLARRHDLRVHATEHTLQAIPWDAKFCATRAPLRAREPVHVGPMEITAFDISHDAAAPVCYRIRFSDGRVLGLATDLGVVTGEVEQALSECDVLGIEANHDVAMLRDGPYPWHLKKRIASELGHLSNDEAAVLVERVATPRLRRVLGLHVSEHNNTPVLARQALEGALRRRGVRAPVTVVEQRRSVSVETAVQQALL
ncbi:MAG: MBL fold metallo-hydrolase [Pseudomonadota bacterium]